MKIDFSYRHETYGLFCDALILSDDHTYSETDIEQMKQQQIDNWLLGLEEMRNTPATGVAPLAE